MDNVMLQGLLFYGMLAVITAVFAELSVRKSSKLLNLYFGFMAVLVPSLFAGLRYGIGTDYFNYEIYFNQMSESIITKANDSFIYLLINKSIGYLGGDFQIVLFIVSLITNLFIYVSLKEYKKELSIGLGMFIYMLVFYQMSFNIIRQIAALAIIFFSMRYILNRNFMKYTAMIIFASGFHLTALIFLPLYFLKQVYGTSKHKIIKIISFSFLIILSINYTSILFPIVSSIDALSYYANSYLYSERSFQIEMGIFLRAFPLIVPALFILKEINKKPKVLFHYNILIIGCISLLIAYSSENYTERISYYFLSSQIILVPFVYRKLCESKQVFLAIMMVLLIVLIWFVDFIYLGRNETVPYQWILTN